MKLTLVISVVLMMIVGLAEAGQGEVCYSPSMPSALDNPLTNETRFACPSLGDVTIPEIYLAGWRVAHLSPLVVGG